MKPSKKNSRKEIARSLSERNLSTVIGGISVDISSGSGTIRRVQPKPPRPVVPPGGYVDVPWS